MCINFPSNEETIYEIICKQGSFGKSTETFCQNQLAIFQGIEHFPELNIALIFICWSYHDSNIIGILDGEESDIGFFGMI